jgi:hypothetical protein
MSAMSAMPSPQKKIPPPKNFLETIFRHTSELACEINLAKRKAEETTDTGPAKRRSTRTNPKACLTELPDELLSHVATYLSQSAFAQLARTNEKLKSIAERHLYQNGPHRDLPQRKLEQFIATISEIPELAQLIEKIDYKYDLRDQSAARFAPQMLGREKRKIHMLWLALASATKVKELSIEENSRTMTTPMPKYLLNHRPRWVDELVHAAKRNMLTGAEGKFTQLKKLTISNTGTAEHALCFEYLSGILCLPSLEEVTFNGFVERKRVSKWACPERASNVKRLVLRNCRLHPDVAEQLLDSFNGLEEVSCSRTSLWFALPVNMWNGVAWEGFGDALERYTLQFLKLFWETVFIADPERLLAEKSSPD